MDGSVRMGAGDGWRACRRGLSTTRVQQTCIGRRGLRQQAALHLCVACRHRRRQFSDWCPTSNLNASVSRRRSWIHARRSTCAVHAAGSGRRGRSSAASARDAVRVCDETMRIRRFHPPRFGPSQCRASLRSARLWCTAGGRAYGSDLTPKFGIHSRSRLEWLPCCVQ